MEDRIGSSGGTASIGNAGFPRYRDDMKGRVARRARGQVVRMECRRIGVVGWVAHGLSGESILVIFVSEFSDDVKGRRFGVPGSDRRVFDSVECGGLDHCIMGHI